MIYSLLIDVAPDPVVGITAVVAIIIFILAFVTILALALLVFLIWRKRRKTNPALTPNVQPSNPNQ